MLSQLQSLDESLTWHVVRPVGQLVNGFRSADSDAGRALHHLRRIRCRCRNALVREFCSLTHELDGLLGP